MDSRDAAAMVVVAPAALEVLADAARLAAELPSGSVARARRPPRR